MKHYIYTEENGDRQLEQATSGVEAVMVAKAGMERGLALSELKLEEGSSGEPMIVSFLAPMELDLQGKIIRLDEILKHIDLLKPGGKLWLKDAP